MLCHYIFLNIAQYLWTSCFMYVLLRKTCIWYLKWSVLCWVAYSLTCIMWLTVYMYCCMDWFCVSTLMPLLIITIRGQSFLTKLLYILCNYKGSNDPFQCMLLLTTELSLLRRMPKQRLSLLFIGLHKPQNFPFPCGISTQVMCSILGSSESAPKRQLDQFSHFSELMEVTDSLATLNSVYSSSALVHILTIAAMKPNNYNNCQDDVSGVSIMASHCEFNDFVWWRQGQHPVASGSQTKWTILGCEQWRRQLWELARSQQGLENICQVLI